MSVKVAVRVRPFNNRELEIDPEQQSVISIRGNITTLEHPSFQNEKKKEFEFDESLWSHSGFKENQEGYLEAMDQSYVDQKDLFNRLGQGILDNVLAGYHCCLFAYGQTGSGKSYSMVGFGANKGIVPMTCQDVFRRINEQRGVRQYSVNVSMCELYNEKLQDLLSAVSVRPKGGLKIREHKSFGVYVDGLVEQPVESVKEIEGWLTQGNRNRTIGSTQMNQSSSRAHTVVCIRLSSWPNENPSTVRLSHLNLVDLAGSERNSKSKATGQALKEGCAINKSLSILSKVISILSTGNVKQIVPYRDSLLTRLLQNALGGNSKTLMICALSPASDNYQETLSTLRYAQQAKRIKLHAKVNESVQDKLIRNLKGENDHLKKMLQQFMDDPSQFGIDKIKVLENDLQANNQFISHMNNDQQAKQTLAYFNEDQASLINVDEDITLTGNLRYELGGGPGRIRLGSGRDCEVIVNGNNIVETHAEIVVDLQQVLLLPSAQTAKVFVNGHRIDQKGQVLQHDDRIVLSSRVFFIFKAPSIPNNSQYNHAFILNELAKYNKEFDLSIISGFLQKSIDRKKSFKSISSSKASLRFQSLVGISLDRKREKVKDMERGEKYLKRVEEANYIAKSLNKNVRMSLELSYQFEGDYLYEQDEEDLNKFIIWVEVYNMDYGRIYRWNKDKFKNRLILMQELIELPSQVSQCYDKYDDPFWDPPERIQLASSFLSLANIPYLLSLPSRLSLQNYQGKTIGYISLRVYPTGLDKQELFGENSAGKWTKSNNKWTRKGEQVSDPYSIIDWKSSCYQQSLGFRIEIINLELNDEIELEDISFEYVLNGQKVKSAHFDIFQNQLQAEKLPIYTEHYFNELNEQVIDILLQEQISINLYAIHYIQKKHCKNQIGKDESEKEEYKKKKEDCVIF